MVTGKSKRLGTKRTTTTKTTDLRRKIRKVIFSKYSKLVQEIKSSVIVKPIPRGYNQCSFRSEGQVFSYKKRPIL